MTAGRGVAHVERTPQTLVQKGSSLHGLQVWLALPQALEQGDPTYSHHPATSLPRRETIGVQITLIAGTGFCLQSPVPMHSPTLCAELRLQAGASVLIPAEHLERALYLIEGEAKLEGMDLPRRSLAVLPQGEELLLSACGECHLVLIGGEPLGPRRMYWNFVASNVALLERAKQDWARWAWPRVPGESTRIELPG